MSIRTERVNSSIRSALGYLLLAKLSDPRLDPARVSITRVEVTEDLLTAKVYVSVTGTKAESNKALAALRNATGYLQEHMLDRIRLRHTPRLTFMIDEQFRKTMDTLALISDVSEELRQIDESRPSVASEESAE